jgi:phosphoribosyl 1,2-cyclic phosphate phosphodiesterase
MSQQIRLLLLGTGAGNANFGTPASTNLPEKDVRRYVSNFLAPDILIDFNHQTPAALNTFKVDEKSIRHLLVSHGHFDHFQPTEILRFADSLPHPLAVYGNTMVRNALEFCKSNSFDKESKRFVALESPFNIEMNVLAPGMTTSAGRAQVTAVQGNHFMNVPYSIMEQQSLNFVIEMDGKTLFYGLDSSYLLPATVKTLSGFRFDIAVLDATFGPLEIDPVKSGHLNWQMLDETIAEMRELGCLDDETILVADHISTDHVGPYDEIADALLLRRITLSYDGLELVL